MANKQTNSHFIAFDSLNFQRCQPDGSETDEKEEARNGKQEKRALSDF